MKNRRERKRDGKGKPEEKGKGVQAGGECWMSSVELRNRKGDMKRKEEESGVEGDSSNGFLSSSLLHEM